MTATVALREYDSASLELSAEVASELARVAKDRLRVGVDGSPGRFRVESMQYVGSIVVPGVSILIRPKVPIENVFLLMEAVSEPEWRVGDFEWDSTAGMLPAFAAFFVRTVERTISRGLLRSYRAEEQWIASLRGRLDIAEQLRRPGVLVPVPCRYDEFTGDVLENQILKAAVLRLAFTPGVPTPIRARLRRLRSQFEEVSDVLIDPSIVRRLHFTRLNERYRPALRLAELVLRNLTLADRRGTSEASTFLIDMNTLFQDFVTHRLRKMLRGILEVESEPPVHLALRKKVRMQPDLVFQRNGRRLLVGDTKYKILGDRLGRDSDYYQMLAYTTALDLPDGVLIYCTEDGPEPDRVIDVQHTSKRLWTYPLDLAGSARDVDESLDALTRWILEHTKTERSLRATA